MPGDAVRGLGSNVGYGAGVGWTLRALPSHAPRLLLINGHITSLLVSQGFIGFKQGGYKAP